SPRRNQQARSGCPHQNSHHLPPLHAAPATKRWQDSIGRKQGTVRRCHQRLSRSVLVSVAAPYSANTPVIALNSDGSAVVAVTVPRGNCTLGSGSRGPGKPADPHPSPKPGPSKPPAKLHRALGGTSPPA